MKVIDVYYTLEDDVKIRSIYFSESPIRPRIVKKC